MSTEADIESKRRKIRQELLALQNNPEAAELAKRIREANRPFQEQLENCLKMSDEVLRRRITI